MALTKVPSNLDAAVSITQSQSDNSTNVATTAYVDLAISNLSDSAPAALNTLNEIAAALGDDANYAATTTAAIAGKLPLAGGALTGNVTLGTASNPTFTVNEAGAGAVTIQGTGSGGRVYSNSGNKLLLGAGGQSAHLTIETDGRVGVGGAPSFTFQVRSPSNTAYSAYNFLTSPNIAFSNATSGAGYYNSLLFGTESNGEVAIGSVQNSSNVAADLVVAIRSGGNRLERMRVTSDGEVGIGTDSPTKSLSVKAPSGSNGGIDVFHNNGNKVAELVHHGSGDEGRLSLYDGGTSTVQLHGETGQPSYINSGNVGIGTASPGALLHIKGTGDAIRVESTNTGQGGAQMDLLHYTSSPADGDIPGVINFGGYYSGTSSAYSAAIKSVWSNAGGREGQLQFTTRQSGSQFDTQLTINHQGHMHLGHDKGSVQFYVGNQGGIFGGNASHWVRGAGNLFMLNAGGTNGSYIFEANGTARLTIANDGVSLASAAPSADSYTHKFRSSNSADPGILLYREGQCALGITVRNSSVDYASFLVGSSGASTSYDTEAGTTNVPLRIYQNGNVVLGRGAHTYNSNDGHIFYSNGRWASTFNYNSAGAEIYIQDNRTASGQCAAFQYRINNSAQSGGTIYAGTNGYTGGNFSDYRLKNNVENLTGSLDKINALRVVSYNHVDSPDLTELGVIAHEIQEVFPEFVRGEKDAVWTQTDIDNYEGTLPDVTAGDIRAQQVDYFSKEWTSHFITAIQELKAELDAAKARITELEG